MWGQPSMIQIAIRGTPHPFGRQRMNKNKFSSLPDSKDCIAVLLTGFRKSLHTGWFNLWLYQLMGNSTDTSSIYSELFHQSVSVLHLGRNCINFFLHHYQHKTFEDTIIFEDTCFFLGIDEQYISTSML